MCLSVCLLTLKILANECTRISAVIVSKKIIIVKNPVLQSGFKQSNITKICVWLEQKDPGYCGEVAVVNRIMKGNGRYFVNKYIILMLNDKLLFSFIVKLEG